MSDGFPPADSTVSAGSDPTLDVPVAMEVSPVRLVDLDPTATAAVATSPESSTDAVPGPAGATAGAAQSAETVKERVSPWSIPAEPGQRVAFSFNIAKIAGQGEDADPILRHARNLGLIGVFDGMGGAGGTAYDTADGSRTGAYLASRTARATVDERMLDLLQGMEGIDGPAIASDLKASIDSALRVRLAELHAPRSILRSKLLRALPTTMATAAVTPTGPAGSWECHLFWAGDSRVYLLDPGRGAAQLTIDDIRDHSDAMANLRQDSTISNAMSADTAFVVNRCTVALSTPFVVIAATDGCFGYLPSPMHFEWLLLSTLRDAQDADMWSDLLQERITAISGDDASMALLGVGTDHQGFQSLFADRTAEVEARWVQPLDRLDAEVADAERQLSELKQRQARHSAELWAAYQCDYEHYIAVDARKDIT